MATSSMAIDTTIIVDFADRTVNDPDDIDICNDEIVSKVNAALETTTGHHHDGTNSRLVLVGGSSFTSSDLLKMLIGRGRI